MDDHSAILTFIATCTDEAKLKQQVKNAKRKGATDVNNAALRRLATVLSFGLGDELTQDLWRTIYILEQILTTERGKTQLLHRTRQKLKRSSVKDTLAGWARRKETDGFKMLMERG